MAYNSVKNGACDFCGKHFKNCDIHIHKNKICYNAYNELEKEKQEEAEFGFKIDTKNINGLHELVKEKLKRNSRIWSYCEKLYNDVNGDLEKIKDIYKQVHTYKNYDELKIKYPFLTDNAISNFRFNDFMICR